MIPRHRSAAQMKVLQSTDYRVLCLKESRLSSLAHPLSEVIVMEEAKEIGIENSEVHEYEVVSVDENEDSEEVDGAVEDDDEEDNADEDEGEKEDREFVPTNGGPPPVYNVEDDEEDEEDEEEDDAGNGGDGDDDESDSEENDDEEEEEDLGTEYLIRPVGPLEDDEDNVSDFEPEDNDEEDDLAEEEEEEDDEQEDDDDIEAGKVEKASKRNRSGDGDYDDERPSKR